MSSLAHSAHVYGTGWYDDADEQPFARRTLATSIRRETCERINLGYRGLKTIKVADFERAAQRGEILVARNAGEVRYKLRR